MRILSHRGIHRAVSGQNSKEVFTSALQNGFGLETDLRDCDGEVVISHDPARKASAPMSVRDFLQIWKRDRQPGAVAALNIKADGLCKLLAEQIRVLSQDEYFFFDMSVPDSLHYLRAGLPVYARVSEFEQAPDSKHGHQGIWLDCFKSEWFTMDDIRSLLKVFGRVAVVSPELHKRPHEAFWRALKETELISHDGLMICTDFPDEMKELVYGKY